MTSNDSQPHVAITGAAGYIGNRVVTELHDEHPDWIVTALDNSYPGDSRTIGPTSV